MEIIRLLENSSFVNEFNIIELKTFRNGYYLKIRAELINNFELYISEYVDSIERNYSYHLQNNQKKMMLRFDNSPHHPDITSFPHHIHTETSLLENYEPSSFQILEYIKNKIEE